MRNALLKLAKRQWITPLTALREVGCMSLSQRMGELTRDGFNVIKDWRELPGGKRIRAYRIVGAK